MRDFIRIQSLRIPERTLRHESIFQIFIHSAGTLADPRLRRIRQRGLEMEVSGSGLAARQSPAAGGYAKPGDTVKVTFELPQGTE